MDVTAIRPAKKSRLLSGFYFTLIGLISYPVMAEHFLANFGIQGWVGEIAGLIFLSVVNIYARSRRKGDREKRLKTFYAVAIVFMMSNLAVTSLGFIQAILMHS